MPPRAAQGDRDAIEEALGPEGRAALAWVCDALGVDHERWMDVPALERVFTPAAVARLAAELVEEGASARAAVEEASIQVGAEPDTQTSRLRRVRNAPDSDPASVVWYAHHPPRRSR